MCYLPDMWHSPTTQCHWGTQGKVLATPQLCLPAPFGSLLPPSLSPHSEHVSTQFSLYSRNIMFGCFTPTLSAASE